MKRPVLSLFFVLLAKVALGSDEYLTSEAISTSSLSTSSSTTSSTTTPPPTANPSDSQKQDKIDATLHKSYGVQPSGSYSGGVRFPVPVPFELQTGPLMMPPGMKPPNAQGSAYQPPPPPPPQHYGQRPLNPLFAHAQPPPPMVSGQQYPAKKNDNLPVVIKQPLTDAEVQHGPPPQGGFFIEAPLGAAPPPGAVVAVPAQQASMLTGSNILAHPIHADGHQMMAQLQGPPLPGSAILVSQSNGVEASPATANHKSAPFVAGIDLPNDIPSGNGISGAGFPSLPSDQWPQPVPEIPQIVNLDVQCEPGLMRVHIQFSKPFNGVIFSKGHYRSANCVHLPPNLGRQSATFEIGVAGCGMQGNSLSGQYGRGSQGGGGSFFENTIVVQYDPQLQEAHDQARRLRCSWHDQYEKSVTFRPFPVDMLDVVRADFAGDNVGCWMQIQVGKGPWASEVSGIVKIGQTMTMVLAIKDEENKFDMLIRNCFAHDGKRQPIQLVDNQGCIVRPKLMSRFTKIKNFGSSASVLSYAHFQAFKFPDSMEVYFQCTIQICRYQCPEQCAQPAESARTGDNVFAEANHQGSFSALAAGRPRVERDTGNAEEEEAEGEQKEVGVKRVIQVVSTGDFAFSMDNTTNPATMVYPLTAEEAGLVCMSTPGFAATVVVLLAILVIACLLSAFLCIRHRSYEDEDAPSCETPLSFWKKSKH